MGKMDQLSRRTFLRGAGTAIALPALEAMIPHKALAAGNVAFPTRMAFVYIPNGVIQKDWNVKGEGSGYHMSRTLQPMEKHREVRAGVVTGLKYGHNHGH